MFGGIKCAPGHYAGQHVRHVRFDDGPSPWAGSAPPLTCSHRRRQNILLRRYFHSPRLLGAPPHPPARRLLSRASRSGDLASAIRCLPIGVSFWPSLGNSSVGVPQDGREASYTLLYRCPRTRDPYSTETPMYVPPPAARATAWVPCLQWEGRPWSVLRAGTPLRGAAAPSSLHSSRPQATTLGAPTVRPRGTSRPRPGVGPVPIPGSGQCRSRRLAGPAPASGRPRPGVGPAPIPGSGRAPDFSGRLVRGPSCGVIL